MGTMIDRRTYRQLMCSQPQCLFILQDAKLVPADALHLNVGLVLSDRLKGIRHEQRSELLENEFLSLIGDEHKELILESLAKMGLRATVRY